MNPNHGRGFLAPRRLVARAPRAVLLAAAICAVLLTLLATAGGGPAAGASSQAPTLPGGKVRTYYIAADTVAWNYAPAGRNMITGKPFGPRENTYVRRGPARIGSTYLKSLYRQYTDGTFRHLVPRPANWSHLGFLGPVIQAEVGDTIVVHFKNNTPFATGMHPHGVRYAKDSEGAPYNDRTHGADKADDAVPPGGTHTYIWQVPERSGPGPGDVSSVMWMYHGHTDEVADTYAGLVGPIIITRRGMARPDGSPKDVDEQFVALFMVADENQSPYLARNIRRYVTARGRRLHDELAQLPQDDDFHESNLMHSINGYVFGNGPIMKMHLGDRVRWYVMSMGTEVDLHTPHWHGNTVTTMMGMRTDVLQLLAGSMQTADMQPDDQGVWLFHCHINDHIKAGMLTRYEVDP
jgi:FtsP/CotA-like multicopper oxidase with cupredoxin domain